MKKIVTSFLLFASLLTNSAFAGQPKLILQIVVDQLRGDLLFKHQNQYGTTGFNYLIQHAIDYHNAHHPHANTTTCAGHATIATGSYPSFHGIVNNDWFDSKSNAMVYCMEDASVNILPTQHSKIKMPGRSALHLTASTLSDELVLAQKGRAFGVSFKDRAAIALAGHAGKAFWFDKSNGGFVTSSYYYATYPDWVVQWNAKYQSKAFEWQPSQPKSSYKNAGNPVTIQEDAAFGAEFPHHVSNPPSEAYFKALSRTPMADQLTVDFAQRLIIQEKLGISPDQTDYLAVSFSSQDAIGHRFGPNSIEIEDNLLQLDKSLSALLATIDKQIGLNNTLIVLTADHGVSDSQAYLRAHNLDDHTLIEAEATEKAARTLLASEYQLPSEALSAVEPPFIYLNHQIIRDHKLDLATVSARLAETLNQQNDVFRAFVLPIKQIENDWLVAKVNRMFYSGRSGDIYLVDQPYSVDASTKEPRTAHGTPWQYDSYVPLLFVHPTFSPRLVSRTVYTTDIAATLAALMKIRMPSAAVGEPLQEFLAAYNTKPEVKSEA